MTLVTNAIYFGSGTPTHFLQTTYQSDRSWAYFGKAVWTPSLKMRSWYNWISSIALCGDSLTCSLVRRDIGFLESVCFIKRWAARIADMMVKTIKNNAPGKIKALWHHPPDPSWITDCLRLHCHGRLCAPRRPAAPNRARSQKGHVICR